MRLAEDVLLLLTDDTSGAMSVPEWQLDLAVAGGALIEVAAADALAVTSEITPYTTVSGKLIKPNRVAIVDAKLDDAIGDDEVLRQAMALYKGLQGRKLRKTLPIIGRALYPLVHRQLQDEGILVREAPAKPSMFPKTTWKTVDSAEESAVRTRLTAALAGEQEPQRSDTYLIALLVASESFTPAFPDANDEARERAQEIRRLVSEHGPCGHILAAIDEVANSPL